jgi:hypothetical protein
MNVNCATYMTKHPNQFSHGLTDGQSHAMIVTPVQSKMFVKMAAVWEPYTVVKYRIRSPVVCRVLNALVMEGVSTS